MKPNFFLVFQSKVIIRKYHSNPAYNFKMLWSGMDGPPRTVGHGGAILQVDNFSKAELDALLAKKKKVFSLFTFSCISYWQAGLGIVQCCNIVPSFVSSIGESWDLGLYFAPQLPRSFEHFYRAGRGTPPSPQCGASIPGANLAHPARSGSGRVCKLVSTILQGLHCSKPQPSAPANLQSNPSADHLHIHSSCFIRMSSVFV